MHPLNVDKKILWNGNPRRNMCSWVIKNLWTIYKTISTIFQGWSTQRTVHQEHTSCWLCLVSWSDYADWTIMCMPFMLSSIRAELMVLYMQPYNTLRHTSRHTYHAVPFVMWSFALKTFYINVIHLYILACWGPQSILKNVSWNVLMKNWTRST